MIKTIEGGIICPNVPEAQIVPVDDGEYLLRIMKATKLVP